MNELNRTSPIPDAAAVAARLMAEFAMRTGLCPGGCKSGHYQIQIQPNGLSPGQ